MEIDTQTDELQKYYEYLKGAKADVPGTLESFKSTLADESSAKQYYNYLRENKFDAPDTYESFSETLGLKKKVASEYVYPTSKVFTDIFSKVAGDIPELETRGDTPDTTVNPTQTPSGVTSFKYPHWTEVSKALGIKVPENTPEGDIEPPKPKQPTLKEFAAQEKPREIIQVSDKTIAENDIREPYIFTIEDYLKKRGVTPETVGLDPKMNTDRLIDIDERVDFDKKLEAKGLYKPTPQYRESYIGAATKGIYTGVANSIRLVGYMLNEVPQQVKKEFLVAGAKTEAKIRKMDSETAKNYIDQVVKSIDAGVYGGETSSILKDGYEDAAKWFESAVKTRTPNNSWGRAVESVGSFGIDLISMSLLPISKAPLLVKYGLQGMLKFPSYLGVKTYVEGAKEGKPLKEIVATSAEATAQAMVYNGLGVWSKEIGELSKSIGAGLWTSKGAEILANSLGFGALTKAGGGEVEQGLVEGIAFSALGVPRAIKEGMQKKAMLNWMTAPINNIRMVAAQKIDPFKLREESKKLWEKAQALPEGEERDHLLFQKNIVDNTIDVSFVTNQILRNPNEFIRSINDNPLLSAREKKIWTNKVNTTVNMVDPRIMEAQPITENIKSLENELSYWQEKTDAEPDIKVTKIEALQNQIKEQKEARIDIFAKPMADYAPEPPKMSGKAPEEVKTEEIIPEKKEEVISEVKTEVSQKETKPTAETKTESAFNKEYDKNTLITKVNEYNKLTPAAKKKSANIKLANDIEVNTQRLGFDKWSKGGKLTKGGIEVKKTQIKVDKKQIDESKSLDDYDEVTKKFIEDVMDTSPNFGGIIIGGLSPDQRSQAFSDIKSGKKSTTSMIALKELEYMFKQGGLNVWDPVSKSNVGISIDQVRAERDADMRKELENYSYLDYEEAYRKKLITKEEYNGIKEFVRDESERNEIASKENVIIDADRYVESGKKEGTGEIKPNEVDREKFISKIFNGLSEFSQGMSNAPADYGSNFTERIMFLIDKYGLSRELAGKIEIVQGNSTIDQLEAIKNIIKQYPTELDKLIKPNEKPNEPSITTGKPEGNIVQGSTETNKKPVAPKGEEKPVRTTDATKQKQIDAIDKEYDAKITGLQKSLDKMDDEARRKVITDAEAEVNRRNTVFGDADAIKDGVIKPEDQGFEVTRRFVDEEVRKFDERKIELTKEIDALNKERESKIGEVLKQQTLGFEEPKTVDNLVSEIATTDLHKYSVDELNNLIKQLEQADTDLIKTDAVDHGTLVRLRGLIGRVMDVRNEVKKARQIKVTKEGVKYGGKTYTDIEQVMDDLADKKLTPDEGKPLRYEVNKFQNELKANAKKNADDIQNRIDKGSKGEEDQVKKDINDKNDKLFIKFFPDIISRANTVLYKALRPVRDALANSIARQLEKGVKNQNDAIRWSTKVLTNLYQGLLRSQADMFGTGKKGEIGKLEMMGTIKSYGPRKAFNLLESWRSVVESDPTALRRVLDVLDPDPAFAIEKLVYGDLNQVEKKLYFTLKEWNTWIHETNYSNGLISTETYLKFKDVTGDSKYIARMYDKFEGNEPFMDPAIQQYINRGNSSVTSKMFSEIYKLREEANEWKKEHAIRDPAYLTAKRVMQTIQNVAIKQYMDMIISQHPDYVKKLKRGEDVPKGYTKLGSSYSWGPFRNMAVIDHIVEDFTGFHYANQIVNTAYDLAKMVDRTKLNQFFKKYRTVYNPFVQTGNVTGNVFFASINGINPFSFVKGMIVNRNLSKTNPALYEMLLKSGLIGDVAMTGEMKPADLLKPKEGALGKADVWATRAYVGADNLAKISAYQIFRRQGMSHEQAVRRAYDAFQNYATVGKTWDFASKVPLIGPTFVKFQADLQRILVNNILTTPLTTIGTFMVIKMLGNLTSALSGETEEEQAIREGRKGVPSIPFLNIPLSFKVGKAELNVARYLSPIYRWNGGDNEMNLSELSKFLPFQFQAKEPGQMLPKFAYADATWGWLGSLISDKDFRGVHIADPKKNAYTDPHTPTDVKLFNMFNYVARSQIPFYKGTADIIAGATGQLDYYERKRTWYQAIINNIIKIQQFDKPEIKAYVEHNLNYLTTRFASYSKMMGDAQNLFYKTLQDGEDKGLSPEAMDELYKKASKLRDRSVAGSLKEMTPIFQEIEQKTEVYKKWHPNDDFINSNYKNIESGKVQRFNVLDQIDFQKKHKDEYFLLKKNDLIKKPEIPKYYEGAALTDEERKRYSNLYWTEYLQQLDTQGILTQQGMDEAKTSIETYEKADTETGEKGVTTLDALATYAASQAREYAEDNFRNQ